MAQVPVKNTCSSHPKQTYQFYCETDKELACRLCVTDTHKGHAFTDLAEHAKVKRRELEVHIQNMNKELQALKSEEKQSDTLLDEIEKRRISILQKINTKAEEVKNEVDNAKGTLEKELNSLQKDDKLLLGNCKQMAAACINKLNKHIQTIQQQISNNDADMLTWISTSNFDPQSFKMGMMSLGKPTENLFIPLEIDEQRMVQMIGHLKPLFFQDHSCSEAEFRGKVNILNSSINFKESVPKAKHVGTVFPVSGDMAWVGFQRPGIIKLVSVIGSEKMSISVDTAFKDMIVTTYGDILVSEDKGFKVWKYNVKSPKMEFYNASPFETRCMTVARNGDILLCLRKKGSNGKVVQLSPNGKVKAEYTQSRQGQKIFVFQKPDRIQQNVNEDILVIEWETKVVLGLTSDLKEVKFTYSGSPKPAGPKPFIPNGITTDKLGHIYITDYENHVIHILSPGGRFLSFINFNELEKRWPRRIAVDEKSFLWIGCNDATVYTISLKDIGLQII